MTGNGSVIYQDPEVLVVYKASVIPTVPLKNKSGDTLLDEVASLHPEVLESKGRNPWEGGVIYRLDTETSGLVLIARTQEAYDELLRQQEEDRILKTYRARISKERNPLEGFEPFPYASSFFKPVTIRSSFRSFGPKGASVRPVRNNPRFTDGKVYTTLVTAEGQDAVLCQITRGFRHQIRCHLAWSGHPIIGDQRYGGEEGERLYLEAIGMEFTSPGEGRKISVRLLEEDSFKIL